MVCVVARALLVLLFSSAACARAPKSPPSRPPPAPQPTASGSSTADASPESTALFELAPRPFTAEEIRDATPQGTVIRLRKEGAETVTEEILEVVSADAAGCTISTMVYDLAGKLIKDQGAEAATWQEIESHATFPLQMTTISRGEIQVPAGRFDVVTYTVRLPDESMVATMHFARRLPGVFVAMTVESQGKLITRVTMLSRTVPNR